MRDIRHGFRSLRRSPATFIAGSAALALGIGLTATMFSVIYGLLIKGLPYDDPSRIAIIKFIDPAHPGVDALVTFGDFAQYRTKQRSFETLAAYTTSTVNVSGGDRPDRVAAASVTPGVLEATRVRPALGRVFDAADAVPSADPAVILSHTVWRDRFAANPKVIGATLRVDGAPHTIVGVMPAGYDFPATTRVWLPLQTNSIASAPGSGPLVYVVGRLRPDASYDNANAELGGLADRFRVLHVPDGSKMHLVVLPFVRASVNPRIYGLLDVMLGAVLLVLLVACANVANLLLDRAVNRTREIGIRTALGASWIDVSALVLRDSARSVMIGLGVGLVLSLGVARIISSELYGASPYDWRTLVALASLLASAGAAATFIPIRRATRVDPVVALRSD